MKIRWTKTTALLSGVALIVIVNAFALGSVAYNRSGEPESVLHLSEREVQVENWNWLDDEKSNIDARLQWQVVHREADSKEHSYVYSQRNVDWLTTADLRSLGFNLDRFAHQTTDEQRYRELPARPIFVVIDFNGDGYAKALQDAHRHLQNEVELSKPGESKTDAERRINSARESLERMERESTRLFVTDLGSDAADLRTRHPNREQDAIVSAQLGVAVVKGDGEAEFVAHISNLAVESIRIPRKFRSIAEPMTARNAQWRYEVTLNVGHRLEPWITDFVSHGPLPESGTPRIGFSPET
jgi:Domain of unknown function (DUF4824)